MWFENSVYKWASGAEFTFFLQRIDKLETFMKQCFSRHWTFRQWRARIPERWEINKVSPAVIPTAYLVRIPSQQCTEGELRPSPILNIKLSGLFWESGKIKAASDHRTEYQRGESCQRKHSDLPTISFKYLGDYQSEHACEETSPGSGGKNIIKDKRNPLWRMLPWGYK